MKKILFVLVLVIVSMFITACHGISSVPYNVFVYPAPVAASDTDVFVGSGLDYEAARGAAIKKALAKGYNRIVAETVGMNAVSGLVNVSLVMIH
jgi:hypothetical protein